MEREKLEKQRKKADKEKAEKEKADKVWTLLGTEKWYKKLRTHCEIRVAGLESTNLFSQGSQINEY